MKRSFLFCICLLLSCLFIACGNGKADKTPVADKGGDAAPLIPDGPADEPAAGLLSFKANDQLYECKPESVRGFYSQPQLTGSFTGNVDADNYYSMAYKFDQPAGAIPEKFGTNNVNRPRLKINGVLYEDSHHSFQIKTVVTNAREVTNGVYAISGTFEGTVLDQDGKVVLTITEGKFATVANRMM
jgi:hypothetical protein